MIRTKLGLLGLCAVVLGMMAMSASPAQANLFGWLILDKPGGTATFLKAVLVGASDGDITLVTHLLGKLFWVTCTSFALEGVNLEALGTLTTGGRVLFKECEAYGKGPLTEPLGCNVYSPGTAKGSKTIKSNEGKGELLLHNGVLVTRIEPKEGETFGTINTEECVMPESNPVRGKLVIKDCLGEAEKHKVVHLIEEEGALTELWVGTKTEEHLLTDVLGSALVLLGGEHINKEWSGIHF